MNILLVRHGQSMSNIKKSLHQTTADHAIPLSDLGKHQARQAGVKIYNWFEKNWIEQFGNTNGDGCDVPSKPLYNTWNMISRKANPKIRLWTSPYKRTRQTTKGIIAVTKDLVTDTRESILLIEQQFGLFDGLSNEQLRQKYPAEQALYKKNEDFEGRFWAGMPLGESRFNVAVRVHQFFGTIQRDKEKHNIENLIVVGHGVTIRAFVMMWCHLPYEWFEEELNPENGSVRLIQNEKDMGYI